MGCFVSVDEVAHFFAFGLEVAQVSGLARDFGGDAFRDGDAGQFESLYLLRIVRDEADC